MKINKKMILLPKLELTEVTTGNDPEAVVVTVSSTVDGICDSYFIRPILTGINGKQRDGSPQWKKSQFNFFPVVLDSHGVPWAEAVVYIVSCLKSVTNPVMATYARMADDLASFRRFLDDTGVDWTHFPIQKLERPTYRYNGHLKFVVLEEELAVSSARRQMGTVIRFYRWLQKDGVLNPENEPWKESDCYIDFTDSRGIERSKKIITTDVSIKMPNQYDPYDGCIDDGGKLRPLPMEEQDWLMESLLECGNTEMTLIHLLGLLTAARIQTILTFQFRHVSVKRLSNEQGEIRLPAGPGTGIDTKDDKQIVLHIPFWFYEMLWTYAHSDRAKKRRLRANGGDHENQYLFLSVRGTPLYQSKKDLSSFDENNNSRYVKSGQAVRQFMTERVIPFIRDKYKEPKFHYKFHDTRATAGMNWTDHQLKLVEKGQVTLHEAREFVKVRMCHNSSITTDLYLQFRKKIKQVRWAGAEYESHLKQIATKAMVGLP